MIEKLHTGELYPPDDPEIAAVTVVYGGTGDG